MSANFSTGAKAAMLGSVGLAASTAGYFLDVYSGARPISADAAVTGAKLVRISLNGTTTGLSFLAPDSTGAINKDPAVVWRGLALAAGTMGYARLQSGTDDGLATTTEVRVDYSVGVSGADINMSSLTTTITPAVSPHSIDTFSISM